MVRYLAICEGAGLYSSHDSSVSKVTCAIPPKVRRADVAFADKTVACRECEEGFIFTAGEQGFYLEKGLMNEPRRCPNCRARRRRDRSGGAHREMHPVVCASCGTNTSVPFLPKNDRPVYCTGCYEEVHSIAVAG